MQEQLSRLSTLSDIFEKTWQKLNLDSKIQKIKILESEINNPEIWKNPILATQKNTDFSKLSNELTDWLLLKTQISDLKELINLNDSELLTEIDIQISSMEKNFQKLKKALRFTGKYDGHNVIIRITSGTGGTEAMDWASTHDSCAGNID